MRISLLLLGIVLSALAANAIWLYEMVYHIGWKGTSWVSAHYYSIYPINFLVVNAFLMPICIGSRYKKKYWKLLAPLYLVSLAAFYVAKPFFLSYLTPLSSFFAVVIAVGLAYYIVAYFLLERLSLFFIPTLGLAVITVIFESTILSENFAIYGSKGSFPDAVKMGYSYFFITINMGLLGILTHSIWLKNKIIPSSDDILDDGWV